MLPWVLDIPSPILHIPERSSLFRMTEPVPNLYAVSEEGPMQEILITAGPVSVRAVLHNTPTAREIGKVLPLHGITQTWGEEVYFTIPIQADLEPDARQDIEVGELGYWPTGPAFCVFFGPTPASTGGKPKAYSPVNIIGRIRGDPGVLKDVPEGIAVVVLAVEEHP